MSAGSSESLVSSFIVVSGYMVHGTLGYGGYVQSKCTSETRDLNQNKEKENYNIFPIHIIDPFFNKPNPGQINWVS